MRESLTPLQLDVFHAFWERYHDAGCRSRPAGRPTNGRREAAHRKEAFKVHPIGTTVRREFMDIRGRGKVSDGEVYDFRDPSWQMRCPGGD